MSLRPPGKLLLNADNYLGQFRYALNEDDFWQRQHQKNDFKCRQHEQLHPGRRYFRIREWEAVQKEFKGVHGCGTYPGITTDALIWKYGPTVSHESGVGWYCSRSAFSLTESDQP